MDSNHSKWVGEQRVGHRSNIGQEFIGTDTQTQAHLVSYPPNLHSQILSSDNGGFTNINNNIRCQTNVPPPRLQHAGGFGKSQLLDFSRQPPPTNVPLHSSSPAVMNARGPQSPMHFNQAPPPIGARMLQHPISVNRPMSLTQDKPSPSGSLNDIHRFPPQNMNRPPPPIHIPQPNLYYSQPSSNHHLNMQHNFHQPPPRFDQFKHTSLGFHPPNVDIASPVRNYFPNRNQDTPTISGKQIFQRSEISTKDSFETECEKKRKQGASRISKWLHNIGKARLKLPTKEQARKNDSSIKINAYLCKLHSSMDLLTKMSGQITKLEGMMSDADKSAWQKERDVMESMKTEQRSLHEAFNPANVQLMKTKLAERKIKRARLKRARHSQYMEKQKTAEERIAKEKEITDWQMRLRQEMKEELLRKKRKEEMDKTLSTVAKRIHDANRLVETMTALEKLRLIRQDAAKKRGDSDIGESRQSFEQKIADMTRLVESQLEAYKEEEQQLRKALTSEQDETSRKEKQLQEEKDKKEQQQKDEDLRTILFGITNDASPADPLFLYQQFYKQAQLSLPAFLKTRQEWDQYCVPDNHPGGSSIPSQWVLPDDPTNSAWASALK